VDVYCVAILPFLHLLQSGVTTAHLFQGSDITQEDPESRNGMHKLPEFFNFRVWFEELTILPRGNTYVLIHTVSLLLFASYDSVFTE
jgi:hypothetical protein